MSLTISLLANMALVCFLVRVNTHVDFQSIRMTKTFLANIALVRFLVRVNTRVSGQDGWISKHLLAHIALVLPSLPLHSFSVFPRLLLLHDIVVTRHARENPPQLLYVFVCFFSLFISLFFFFLYLMMICLEIIRNPRTQHHRFFFHFFFLSRTLHHLQNPSLRSPRAADVDSFASQLLVVVVVVVVITLRF